MKPRLYARTRCLLRAKIIFNGGRSTMDCIVKNISENGAMVDIGETIALPQQFDLDVPQKGKIFRAIMRWRSRGAMGMDFVRETAPESAVLKEQDLTARVRELEADNAELRRHIENLLAGARRHEEVAEPPK